MNYSYKKWISLLFICFFSISSFSQTIKRWNGGSVEMKDKILNYELRDNIFKDFLWLYPNIESEELQFESGECRFSFNGLTYLLTKEEGVMMLSSEDKNMPAVTSEQKRSKNDMYYDKSKLRYKTVTEYQWQSRLVLKQRMVAVQRSRLVTSYVYRNGKSQPQTRTEYYTAYEQRSAYESEWRYEPYTKRVIDIPSYDYFSFKLSNGTQIVVYRSDSGSYFLQTLHTLLQKTKKESIIYLLMQTITAAFLITMTRWCLTRGILSQKHPGTRVPELFRITGGIKPGCLKTIIFFSLNIHMQIKPLRSFMKIPHTPIQRKKDGYYLPVCQRALSFMLTGSSTKPGNKMQSLNHNTASSMCGL